MDKLIVALNKVDMFPVEERVEKMAQQSKKLQTRFAFTRFGSQIPIIPVAAAPRDQTSEEKKLVEETK